MVVAGILALALALPTGALFGIGYGTGVRIGYEQIYPLLFPADKDGKRNTTSTVNNVKQINEIYNAIGGKEASQMGIATGLASAMSELDTNPDFRDLLALESSLSGSTPENSAVRTRYGLDNISQSAESFSERDTPASFLDNPIIIIPEDFGPKELSNQWGFKEKSLGQLLDLQSQSLNWFDKTKRNNLFDHIKIKMDTNTEKQQEEFTNPTKQPIKSVFTSKNPGDIAKTDYVVLRASLLTTMFYANLAVTDALSAQSNASKSQTQTSSNSKNHVNAVRLAQSIFSNAQKAVLSHITLARNVGHTKALANTDWNNRIWQI